MMLEALRTWLHQQWLDPLRYVPSLLLTSITMATRNFSSTILAMPTACLDRCSFVHPKEIFPECPMIVWSCVNPWKVMEKQLAIKAASDSEQNYLSEVSPLIGRCLTSVG